MSSEDSHETSHNWSPPEGDVAPPIAKLLPSPGKGAHALALMMGDLRGQERVPMSPSDLNYHTEGEETSSGEGEGALMEEEEEGGEEVDIRARSSLETSVPTILA